MPISEESLKNLIPFKKGQSGNPNGRPVGSISPITKIKQMFEENPERYEEFIEEYSKNKANHKHLVEMIDGKPRQTIDSKVEAELTINVINYGDSNSV